MRKNVIAAVHEEVGQVQEYTDQDGKKITFKFTFDDNGIPIAGTLNGRTIPYSMLDKALDEAKSKGLYKNHVTLMADEGDVTGAALEVGSGLASTVPGVGTAASVAADAALAAKDIKNAENEIQQVSESSGVSAAEVVQPENMKDIVNIDSKRTIVRTTLETDGLENMLQKMLPNMPQNNTIVAPNNTLNTATNTTTLPRMTNKNLDTTINSLKNVY